MVFWMRPYDVAVCCFNERFTIRRCLTAIQAFADYERLIVVDDRSDDGTAEVAEAFADVFLSSGRRLIGALGQSRLCLEYPGCPRCGC